MNAAFTVSGVAVTVGQAFDAREIDQWRVQGTSIIGKKMQSSGFFAGLQRRADCGRADADLRGEARIDGAAAGAGAIQLLAGEIGVDEVLGFDAEAFEVGAEQRRVDVACSARAACRCAGSRAFFISATRSLRGCLVQARDGNRIGHQLGSCASGRPRARPCRRSSGICFLTASSPALMSRMSSILFHRALFAGGDDQALLAGLQRNLGLDDRRSM